MKKQEFEIEIDAPKEKVWSALFGNETYPKWAAVFSEGSRAETDWKEGSKVLFLNGQNEGMVSKIVKKTENEYMSFEHLGFIMNGVEDYESEGAKQYAGVLENYTLLSENGKTKLKIDLDVADEHLDYFKEAWPKALNTLKEIAENDHG